MGDGYFGYHKSYAPRGLSKITPSIGKFSSEVGGSTGGWQAFPAALSLARAENRCALAGR